MKNYKKGFIKTKTGFAAWICAGLLAAWMAAVFFMGLSENGSGFHQNGRICDFSPELINLATDAEGLEEQNGDLLVTAPLAKKTFYLRSQDESWSYAYVNLGYLSAERLNGILTGYDSNFQETAKMEVSLYSGKNEIALGEVPLSSIQLQIPDQAGISLYISSMEITEFRRNFRANAFWPAYLLSFLLFLLFSGLALGALRKRREKDGPYAVLQTMQQVWMKFAGELAGTVENVSERAKSNVRTACFLIIHFTMLFVTKFLNYHNSMVYRMEIGIVCACIGIAAITCLKRNMKVFAFRNPLALSWYLLCLLMCLSDFIVRKRIMYTGYWLMLVWGFFFWAWNNMEHPEDILKEWIRAFEAAFWASILFCLLCTVQVPEFYRGMANNPNTLGQFMSIAIAVFLSLLLEREKLSFPRLLLLSLGLDYAVYFTLLSQCRSGILADAAVAVLAILWLAKSGKKKGARRHCLMAAVLMIALWLPVSVGSEFAMTHNGAISDYIPDRKPVQYETDQLAGQGMAVYAAEDASVPGKIMDRFKNSRGLDQFSSGRLYIYRRYMESMNLFGHYGNVEIYGLGMGAHNSILMIGYRYGIFAIIPYLLIIAYIIWYSWRHRISSMKTGGAYGFTANALIIASVICGMLDHIEQPMRYMPWLVQYILVGYFLCWDDKHGTMEKNMQC